MSFKRYPRRDAKKNYFQVPNEVFCLGLSSGEILVYTFLLYCEDRKTYRCHPSYATIGKRVGMSKNTVKKYVSGLVKKKLITTEPSRIITSDGRKRNGSLIYNIRPIEEAIRYYYVRQIENQKRNIAVRSSTHEKQKRPKKAG